MSYEVRDEAARGNRGAVYATDDAWWALWFAVIDRDRLRGSMRDGWRTSPTRPGIGPDDWRMAINVAVDSLLPKANARGARGAQAEAALRAALDAYARDGGRSLQSFIDMLKDLPDGVSQLSDRRRIAAGLADALYAATVNDPLFGGAGEPADPGMLLTPPPGKRARVSVISFVGLPATEQKQNFANQLQMALFAWIKEHCSGEKQRRQRHWPSRPRRVLRGD